MTLKAPGGAEAIPAALSTSSVYSAGSTDRAQVWMYRASGNVFPKGSASVNAAYSADPRLPMVVPVDLDATCGKYLKFRDLVECGETWAALARAANPIQNRPTQLATIEALEQLCRLVLDPVIEAFGS